MSTGLFASENTKTTLITQSEPEAAGAGCLQRFQSQGWEEFQSLPMPKRTDEPWRFANLSAIDISNFITPCPVPDAVQADLIARSIGLEKTSGRMIFANDQLLQREILSEELKSKGVIWEPIEKAATDHQEIFSKHFMAQETILGAKKFAALHKSQVKSGTFLYVPRNVEIELPLEVFHWLHGENNSTFPHTLLIVGENSKVTLVDYFQSSQPDVAGFACGVNDLYVEAGAKLTYVGVQNWSRKVLSFQINATQVGRDGNAVSMNLNLGGAYARTESVSRLIGQGSRSDMLAVSVANETQEFDQRTLQDHLVPNTSSDLLYKNSLDDKTRTIFSGLIRVQPGAHKTDAYQKVRNLLLSDESEANSAPGLEILADDVRCTHGATSGQIDADELFYLLARGIDKKTAQKLIVHGFLDEVIQRLGNKALEEKLSGLVHAKFEGSV